MLYVKLEGKIMSETKKVILFIVEGISDKVSLESVLSTIISNKKISFQITYGDITSQNGVHSTNIITKITGFIAKFLKSSYFKKKDLLKVIQLVDTDGAFVNESAVVYKDCDRLHYTPTNIETNNVEAILARNKNKSRLLQKISTKGSILNIPYQVYFFSSNLEHVLHGIQNPDDDEKMELAEKFNDEYDSEPQKFIDFISSKEFAVPGDYKDSWNFIMQDLHSLNRFSNFHLFFK